VTHGHVKIIAEYFVEVLQFLCSIAFYFTCADDLIMIVWRTIEGRLSELFMLVAVNHLCRIKCAHCTAVIFQLWKSFLFQL